MRASVTEKTTIGVVFVPWQACPARPGVRAREHRRRAEATADLLTIGPPPSFCEAHCKVPPNPKLKCWLIILKISFGFGGGARRAVGAKACAMQVFSARERNLLIQMLYWRGEDINSTACHAQTCAVSSLPPSPWLR